LIKAGDVIWIKGIIKEKAAEDTRKSRLITKKVSFFRKIQ